MQELIEVKINEKYEQIVSARALHKFLESGERFSKWFARMVGYGFKEDADFTGVLFGTAVGNGAHQEFQDYALKIDMAKQLCMLARSDKGKQARQYFLQVEKDWNSPEKVMARALFIAGGQIEKLKKELDSAERRAALREKALTEAFRLLEGAAARIVKEVAIEKEPQPRRHYKAQKMPFELRRAIDRKLEEGATYQEIAAYVREMGNFISTSALHRYNYQRLHHPENLRT
ncbi:MAG: antA/AntB antirepressor family protein [Acidaminococcales bacterium]|jgi:anti-repressor protein|nr:antA/AntB antirepressor family protein [Acidaminococcales bacterium]